MASRPPQRGQIINYSYLWHREQSQGAEEGRKNRPCAIVLTLKDGRVVVAAITHTQPKKGTQAIEIPASLTKQAGLDHEKSWVITSEVNYFRWPGMDLRPIPNKADRSFVYGQLPPTFTNLITKTVQTNARSRVLKHVKRDDPEDD